MATERVDQRARTALKNNQRKSNDGRGGKRLGAGRKKGTPNKRTSALVEAVVASGITPLDYMLNVMRDPIPADAEPRVQAALHELRFEAAKAAAPYVHPKLAAIEHTGKDGQPLLGNISITVVGVPAGTRHSR